MKKGDYVRILKESYRLDYGSMLLLSYPLVGRVGVISNIRTVKEPDDTVNVQVAGDNDVDRLFHVDELQLITKEEYEKEKAYYELIA